MSQVELPTRAQFAEQLNQTFVIQLGDESILHLTLAEVSEFRESARQARFSLIFTGPGETFLPQQVYSLHHEALGNFDLFLVPVGNEQDNFLYQAVFNQLRKPDSTS